MNIRELNKKLFEYLYKINIEFSGYSVTRTLKTGKTITKYEEISSVENMYKSYEISNKQELIKAIEKYMSWDLSYNLSLTYNKGKNYFTITYLTTQSLQNPTKQQLNSYYNGKLRLWEYEIILDFYTEENLDNIIR